eukprot:TRINITY_DN764_c0_g1_i14.p1 TRINITY_DN764_c0_g1~~TRINITY_DN764_c0_g1_i14.p1  ORF type:complete len:191 (+),score=16.50 TRINITY_DN764_c0_g1_i14:3-575(+)
MLNGVFSLEKTVVIDKPMVISSFNLFSLATLVCSSTTKGILVTQTSRLSHLRITGCNESGVEIHLLSPNEMSSDLDSLEVFGNGRGINVISSGYYTRPLTITNSSIHDNYIRSKDLVSNSLGGYGITISGSMVYLGNVAIERNEGDGPGGGILVRLGVKLPHRHRSHCYFCRIDPRPINPAVTTTADPHC